MLPVIVLFLVFRSFTLIKYDMLTVSNRDSTQKEPLQSIVKPTFNVSWENNSTYQITFTAYSDNSIGYALLVSENIITWQGQQFVIKQSVPNYSGRYNTVAITATHIYLDVRKIFQHNKKDGTLTYSISDVLSFYLSNNSFGYSFDVKGNFAKKQITDLGGNNAFDGLSQIISTWPDAYIYPDNKKIVVYDKANFATNLGNRLGYGYNSDNVAITYDSTSIINQLTVISTKKDDGSVYFQPHVVKDDDSIAKYGVWDGGDFSDERFHDVQAADEAAKEKFIVEPSISVSLDYLDSDEPVTGEIRRLEILDTGFVTNVMVVAYSYYPLDDTQKTSLTLNSNAKTVLDYQRSNRNALNQAKNLNKDLAISVKNTSDKINVITTDGIWYDYRGGAK
ncbi:prophage endopeptidase tail family protein [Leuconostoc carnosum]|uniref:prophage endopeptidase tail family protein n=1 Tax=Leuconostoc carnosum TaxID=1252 RepID=UPI0016805FE1|nr:prophage endopeptidase tail family protein [Leuconostoc carnosum]